MTALELITAGIALLLATTILAYSGWLFVYALRDDSVVRERLKQVTR